MSASADPSSEWTGTADGIRLFTRHWRAEEPVAGALVVHGLGDHSGRYGEVAGRMVERGISVTAFDLRGHGRSPGRRGDAPSLAVLLSDIDTLGSEARRRSGNVPWFLVGHSMGGLLALVYALEAAPPELKGLVVSAPWLATRSPVPGWKELLGRVLLRLAPGLGLATGMDPEGLSGDPEWVRAYREDPLVHRRISSRLYDAVKRAQERAYRGGLNLPGLFLVPEEDPVVDPVASRALAEEEGADVQIFPGFRHEGFGEPDRESFIRAMTDWILARAQPEPNQNHGLARGYPGTKRRPAREILERGVGEPMIDDPAKSVEEEVPSGDEERVAADSVSDAPAPPDAAEVATSAEEGAESSPEEEEEEAAEEELEGSLDSLQREFDALHDRHLRLAADFENYRRRAETEMRQSWIRAQADLLRRLLDALDDLQRVTDVEPGSTSVEPLLEGVQLVEKKLGQTLEEAGAEVVNPVGDPFDPTTMEAIMTAAAESEEEDETVAQVFQKGYTFKGHLVRPARVSVKKHG